ncbi:hypothetical protein PoB_002375800 [Plakobranchus ocellatus]|uniref:Uncharacterized protein n=1 Tax=Plakobranchus ocellatus TaxID=259542 RepID=A0AAV3ZS26_9GAST|nr:hypothetical protein PoB_002375800 [Plakobranchus ocellatus]
MKGINIISEARSEMHHFTTQAQAGVHRLFFFHVRPESYSCSSQDSADTHSITNQRVWKRTAAVGGRSPLLEQKPTRSPLKLRKGLTILLLKIDWEPQHF